MAEKPADAIHEVLVSQLPIDDTLTARETAERIAALFEPVGWRFVQGGSIFGARGVDYSDRDKPDAPNPTEVVWAVRRGGEERDG